MKDAYELLGLAPGASEHDVKKAFRRLAMRWHPDRNADPAALEHFKALRAAYDSLLAALRADAPDGATQADEEQAEEDTGAPRGADRRDDLTLDIEAACLGGEKTITLEDESICAACDGSGEEALRHTRLCAACHGTGRVHAGRSLAPCKHCAGRGYLTKQACHVCDGSGRRRVLRPVIVPLPPGLLDGDEVRVAGEGDLPAAAGGRPGDLIVRIRLAPHALYRLDGRNLILSRPVSALRLLVGGEVAVPLPGGARVIDVPPGGATARELRIAGAGFPAGRGKPAGDLIVHLVPVLPEAPDAELRALLEQLERLLAADLSRHLPDVATWEARWLDDGSAGC